MNDEQKIQMISAFLNTPPADMYLSKQALALKKMCVDILLEDIDNENKITKIHHVLVTIIPTLNVHERLMTWFEGIKAFCSAVLAGEFTRAISLATKAVHDKKAQIFHFQTTFFGIMFKKMVVIGAQKNNPADCVRFDSYCAKNNITWRGHKEHFNSSLDKITQKEFLSEKEFVREQKYFIEQILEHVTRDFNSYLENELPEDLDVDILMIDRCVINYFEPNFESLLVVNRKTYSSALIKLIYELIPELNKKVISKFIEACMARLKNNATLIIKADAPHELAAFFDSSKQLQDPLLLGADPDTAFDGMWEYTGFKSDEFKLADNCISSLNL